MSNILKRNREREAELFAQFLKIPGTRKAKQGLLFETPEGFFHMRGFAERRSDFPDEAQFYLEFCTDSEIRRILRLKNPNDYLLKMRADGIADNPRLLREISYRKIEWEGKNRVWSLTNYYNFLDVDARKYIKPLPKRNKGVFNKLVYGRVPIIQPNGLCFRSLVGDLVIVSDTLHYFFYFITISIFFDKFKLSREQAISAFLIALRIMKGVESLDFDMDPREKLPSKTKSQVYLHVSRMMQFTFGHEFAHFSLGHLDAQPSEGEHEINFEHQLEYEADEHAIVLHGANTYRAGDLLHGAQCALLAFYALARVGSKCSYFPDFSISQTHPSPVDRIEAVQNLKIRRNRLSQIMLDRRLELIDFLVDSSLKSIGDQQSMFSTYGSVYMQGFDVGKKRDRLDY
mgnify:CR=1 FL=1